MTYKGCHCLFAAANIAPQWLELLHITELLHQDIKVTLMLMKTHFLLSYIKYTQIIFINVFAALRRLKTLYRQTVMNPRDYTHYKDK